MDFINFAFTAITFVLLAAGFVWLVARIAKMLGMYALDLQERRVQVRRMALDAKMMILTPQQMPVSRQWIEQDMPPAATAQLYRDMLDSVKGHAPALHTYAPHSRYDNRNEAAQLEEKEAPPFVVPTFSEMWLRGLLREGEMCFGYTDDGKPIYGTWKDMFHVALCGKSGSGKTTTLRFLVAQAAIHGCKFVVLDPHGHAGDESLASALSPFHPAMLCEPAIDERQVIETIRLVRSIGQRRINGDPDRSPIVVVVDELNMLLNRTGIGKELAPILEGNAQEFRKVCVYLLAAGQNWSAKRVGGDTGLRSAFASALVHRTDPEQARGLLPNEEAKQVQKYANGVAMFKNTDGDFMRLRIPNTTAMDVKRVASELYTSTQKVVYPAYPEETTPIEQAEINHPETRNKPELLLSPQDALALEMFQHGHLLKDIATQAYGTPSGEPYTKSIHQFMNLLREALYRSENNG